MNEYKRKKLPTGWRWTSLGNTELITIIMGQSPPGETYNKEKNGLPFFQGCADFGNIYPEPTVWCSKPKKIAEPNDLLLSVRAPVGPTNVAKEKCCIGRGLAALRSKEGLTYKYLKWILRKFEKQISYGGSGSIFNAIGKDEIKDIFFPFPTTLDDQIAIADKLERKMAEIEKMHQAALSQKEAITAMQGAILRDVFPYKEGDKLLEGWRWEPLLDICSVNPRRRKDFFREPNAQTSFVPMESVDELTGSITKKITRTYSEISKGYTFFEEGDVLFAKITPCMQNGKSAIAKGMIDEIGFGSTEFHVLRPKIGVIKEWIYYFVRTSEFRKRAENHFEGSAGQQRVSVDFIENALISLPPTLDDQITIASELERKMAEIEKMRQAADNQLEAIEALQGAILRVAFDFEEEEAS